MYHCESHDKSVFVALLAEGVDRNDFGFIQTALDEWSPSSRRAWIEIDTRRAYTALPDVALLAEGVDRNHLVEVKLARLSGRPPRGGRG